MQTITPDSLKNRQLLFFFILCAAALLRAYMITLNMNILLDQGLVQDDAFYYYVIARHIIEQGYSSFDGINLTNGYHPVWQAISIPVFYFCHGDTPVRAMLAIASCFDLMSLVLFYKILLRAIKNDYVVLIGVSILAFHGTIIRTWFNGLETAISIFSLLWLLHQFLSIKNRNSNSLKDHLWLGAISAFSFLSRTDNAVIIVTIFLFLYLPPLFKKKEYKNGLVASTLLLILVGPWLAWNIMHFGSIVQISGQIRDNTWLTTETTGSPIQEKLIYDILTSIDYIKTIFEKMFSPGSSQPISGYFFIPALIVAVIYTKTTSDTFKKNIGLFFPFIAGVIVLFLYHAGLRHFVRGWYNAPVLLILTLLFCLLLDATNIKSFAIFHKITFIVILAGLITFYSPYNYTKQTKDSHLDARIATAEWINLHSPPSSIVGAANAGIMAYYTNRTVINLDGVVNEPAFHARLSNQLPQYILESHINYIADHKGSIAHLCKTNAYYTCTQVDNLGLSTQVMQINN